MLMILPSLASADQMKLGEELEKVKCFGRLHFDIEDGNFVPNITFGFKTIRKACERLENTVKDAHLMVTDPEAYIAPLAELGFHAVCFHWEAAPYPMRLIQKIRKNGMKAGIALNPRTPVGEMEAYLPLIDYILLMSSEPDEAGEQFQELTYEKIRYLSQKKTGCPIVVDGGINMDNVLDVFQAGAAGVVMGRAVFGAEDPRQIIRYIQNGGD